MRLNALLDSAGRAAGTGAAAVAAEDSERLGFVTLAQFLRQLPAAGRHARRRQRRRSACAGWSRASWKIPPPTCSTASSCSRPACRSWATGGSEARVDAYVRRLVEARVGALGFGLEPYFDAVPDAVVRACRQHNLTLVADPGELPFAALGLEFSRLLESDNAKTFRQLADTNRQLMRAVLSARPEHELLAALVAARAGLGRAGRRRRAGARPGLGHLPGPQRRCRRAGAVPGVDAAALAAAAGPAARRQRPAGGDGFVRRSRLIAGLRVSAAQHPGRQPRRALSSARTPR